MFALSRHEYDVNAPIKIHVGKPGQGWQWIISHNVTNKHYRNSALTINVAIILMCC